MKQHLTLICVFCWIAIQGKSVSPGFVENNVPLYGGFELVVINNREYKNKFDYQEIELKGEFTSPSNQTFTATGFFDGDGQGGQNGTVWRLRFMPTEIGAWTYAYTFSDNTVGGDGSFSCIPSDYKGPLQIDPNNPWFFITRNGEKFHAWGYDMHHVGPDGRNAPEGYDADNWATEVADVYIKVINNYMLPCNYNLSMLDSPSNLKFPRTWWHQNQKDIFDVQVWQAHEKILLHAREHGIYLFHFDGLIQQENSTDKMSRQMCHYFVSRFASYYNYFGFNIARENWKLPRKGVTYEDQNEYMLYVCSILPENYKTLLTIHDQMMEEFANWQDFHIRQHPAKHIEGQRSPTTNQKGNVNNRNVDADRAMAPYGYPIIGSEDIWDGIYQIYPAEVVRSCFGGLMAGIIPLYSEWNHWAPKMGDGPGEIPYRNSLNWWYNHVDYRHPDWQQLNSLVSGAAFDVGSGIPGIEYVAYREGNGEIIIDLSDADGMFAVNWYNPIKFDVYEQHMVIEGGGPVTLFPPFDVNDCVVFLKRQRN